MAEEMLNMWIGFVAGLSTRQTINPFASDCSLKSTKMICVYIAYVYIYIYFDICMHNIMLYFVRSPILMLFISISSGMWRKTVNSTYNVSHILYKLIPFSIWPYKCDPSFLEDTFMTHSKHWFIQNKVPVKIRIITLRFFRKIPATSALLH